MQRLYQVVLAIAVMAAQVLPSPSAMTCFLQLSLGFGAERACCRHMPSTCGAESKPSSAGCCVRKTDGADLQAISPEPLYLDRDLASIGSSVPFVGEMDQHHAGGVAGWLQTHPPGPDLSETTHLRI